MGNAPALPSIPETSAPERSGLHVLLGSSCGIPRDALDSRHDHQYAKSCKPEQRGGETFYPPQGFTRIALAVSKYGNGEWLNNRSGWPIAYRGVPSKSLAAIVQDGFTFDNIQMECNAEAARNGCRKDLLDQQCDIVLLCRVRPGGFARTFDSWVVKKRTDVRPVAILVKVNLVAFIQTNYGLSPADHNQDQGWMWFPIGRRCPWDNLSRRAFQLLGFASSSICGRCPKAGWLVAYHGTPLANVKSILEQGLKVRGGKSSSANGEFYGTGIYVTPDITLAHRFCFGANLVHVVLKLFIRPDSFSEHHAHGYRYWVVKHDQDIAIAGLMCRE